MVPLLQSSNLFNTVEVDDNCYDKYQDPPPLPDPVIPTDIFLPSPYYMESSDTYQPQHNITRPPRLPMSYHSSPQGLPPTHCNQPQVITPQCLPIQGRRSKNKNESLPSSTITSKLTPAIDVVRKYPNLRKENVIGKLAVKLAKEAFFGDDVMIMCTVMGCSNYPALPTQEFQQLKQTIFSLFPACWLNHVEFESKIWSQCVNSIGQLCKCLRDEHRIKGAISINK